MNFATLAYAIFLLVVVVAYWAVPRRAGRYLLIAASLVFYGTWNPIYVPAFTVILLGNYGLGLLAARPGRGRTAIALAVALDLGTLAIFKYLDWLLGSSVNLIERLTGQPVAWGPLGLVLPLAISFVTFTTLAYVIDIARGGRPERDLGRFALFVTFFPHLIAGPIMRAHEFLPQVRHPRPFATSHIKRALPLLVGGLLKKTIGDNLAPIVGQVFGDPGQASSLGLWLGVVAFAFQIFLDFSGYSDLALGSAWLLGFKLPLNFNWPYRSLNIQEFWRHWHMTLSRWLRDYVYIALGGSRRGLARTYVALMATMLLGGLWHGAGLTFIVWGGLHGIGLAVHRWWRTRPAPPFPVPAVAAWAMTFGFVLIGWVFFRAGTMEAALAILHGMVVPHGGRVFVPLGAAIALAAMIAGQWPGWWPWLRRLAPHGTTRRYLAYGAGLAAAVVLIPAQTVAFIYFQF